ncbi:MAG: nucleotidyltransferase [Lachnospiraceae bacterium]|nr:nucleotidyltransferase [Lachnospiraceae bacterium]
MRISAVICEYNPFHNGHKYQLEEIKKRLKSDYIIAIMSGNFVQRGAPAICDKYARAKAALSYADLVIELPTVYATGSAEAFATGAVRILEGLGCVDDLVFGAEDDCLDDFSTLSELLTDEPDEFSTFLKEACKSGLSYPAARQHAVSAYLGTDRFEPLLRSPNNLLALEYMRAIKRLNASMKPYIIKREGAGYHEEGIDTNFPSATAIRNKMNEGNNDFSNIVPSYMNSYLSIDNNRSFPVNTDDFSDLLFYRLEWEHHPEEILDFHPEMYERIKKFAPTAVSFTDLIEKVKTKNFTYTRISRYLLHLILGVKAADYEMSVAYAKVLGFRKDSSPLLKIVKEKSQIPVIQKPARYQEVLSSRESGIYELDLFASRIYYGVIRRKFHTCLEDDLARPLLIV